jgi:hypothetical protein
MRPSRSPTSLETKLEMTAALIRTTHKPSRTTVQCEQGGAARDAAMTYGHVSSLIRWPRSSS